MIAVFMLLAPQAFLGYRIYMAFLTTIPFALIMALGSTYVIISGEIDLSFPGVISLAAYAFTFTMDNTGNSILAVLAGLIAGIIMGAINGVMVTKVRIPSIIATLGASFLWAGVALVLSQSKTISIGFVRELLVWKIFVSRIGGIFPVQSLWAFGIAILLGLILARHRFGEAIIFTGDNREAARVLGVNTDKVMIQVFSLAGLLSAFAGMLATLNLATWWPLLGPSYLLPVLAAVFLGGTQMVGGEGTILGTVVGAFILGSMTAGIVAAGVGAFWVQFVQGAILLGAVFLNRYLRERAEKAIFRKNYNRV
jgi:simple sugar transport system permease protein